MGAQNLSWILFTLAASSLLGAGCAGDDAQEACADPDDCPAPGDPESDPLNAPEANLTSLNNPAACKGLVKAEVVAIDQVYVYNRFGSFNPAGMIFALRRDVVAADSGKPIGPGNVMLREGKRPRPLTLRANVGDTLIIEFTNWLAPSPPSNDSPVTRTASIHVNGLQIKTLESLGGNVGYNPSSLAAPGETRTYKLEADREGTFFMHSAGAMAGGQGDGGQIVHGLFGAINVEPPGSVWYRSQVTAEALAAATVSTNPNGTPILDYDAVDASGAPILRIKDESTCEIVHSDLNAIIDNVTTTEMGTPNSINEGHFREQTVVFHDELKTVHPFQELEQDEAYQGVRDGFGINYGAAGLGAELLANRKKIGPTKNCIECKFEEFFLSSWANGDPALNIDKNASGKAIAALYPDDPSNVHHGYLGDPTRIRNTHAGPKETHVFHLHGHQWLRTPSLVNSNYLDSQSIGPGVGITYNIAFGGGGNRNLTVGDAIFHCHLYPHLAQGMWALWRNHDVFEAGTPDRNLPDGEIQGGTPTPAVVPLPGRAIPPMPTYVATNVLVNGKTVTRPAMPGYPHYIAAQAGHRPPQPPLDLAHNGGLPRHIVTSVPKFVRPGPRGEFDTEILKANLKLLPEDGTPPEKSAMKFHGGQFPGAVPVTTPYGWPGAAYPSFTPEGAPAKFVVNGQPPTAGAPYANPCPPSANVRNFSLAFVQIDGVVNTAGWHDPQMRLMVLADDVPDTLNGTRPPEPLFVRALSNECVVSRATNLIPGALEEDDFQIFTPTDSIGQHIHLFKFDVTSSDGGANGWNYEDGVFAAEEVVARIKAANALGGALVADGTLNQSGARVPLAATSNPFVPLAPLGAQTGTQRFWADPLLDIQGMDRTLRSAFMHDHLSASSHQQHGLYAAIVVEPWFSEWRDPETGQLFGTRPDGGPTSYRADIIVPGVMVFREFNLAIQDFALLYDDFDNPVNPPGAEEAPLPLAIKPGQGGMPEVVSARDPGSMLVNYRNEPIPLRIAQRQANGTFKLKSGQKGEMQNVFRSNLHGDPATPILEIYRGDPVQIRAIDASHEEQHAFSINGRTWLKESEDPSSGLTNVEPMGVSERFDLVLRNDEVSAGDYLYASAPTDDLWNGLWGILRSHGKLRPNLLPLPGYAPTEKDPAGVCPPNAPVRSYTVHAVTAKDALPGGKLYYNKEYDLWDPDAILFIEASKLAAVESGARKPEPLILRAAAGDCIKVTLINELPSSPPKTPHWNYNPPITDGFNTNQVLPSNHVSLHAQLLRYDIETSDGANIGKNKVQTVPPGDSRTYTWYAGGRVPNGQGGTVLGPIEFGTVNLRDMADVVNHGMHGAVGQLIVEPLGASWVEDPGTSAQATVTYVDAAGKPKSFRDFVVVYQDEIGLHTGNASFKCAAVQLNCGTAVRNLGAEDDAEDSGHDGFNYRLEPLWARYGLRPELAIEALNNIDQSGALDSDVFGDPATPIFVATPGKAIRIRVGAPSGHARQHAFTPWGTEFPRNPFAAGSGSRVIGPNPTSPVAGTVNTVTAQVHETVVPLYGAGGKYAIAGDYLYRDEPSFSFTDGAWGILRVAP